MLTSLAHAQPGTDSRLGVLGERGKEEGSHGAMELWCSATEVPAEHS